MDRDLSLIANSVT